jgi:hypothetical protein
MRVPSWLTDVPRILWEDLSNNHTAGYYTTTCDSSKHWRTYADLTGDYAGLTMVRHSWKEGSHLYDALELFVASAKEEPRKTIYADAYLCRVMVRKGEKEWPGTYLFDNPGDAHLFPALRQHVEKEMCRMLSYLNIGIEAQAA